MILGYLCRAGSVKRRGGTEAAPDELGATRALTHGRRSRELKLKPVANVELWQALDELIAKHRLKFTRVAGHSGHPENDRCDELAVAAYQQYL